MKAQQIHEGVNYHLERGIPLHESVYRLGSDEYFNMFAEARKLYTEGKLKNLHWFDEEILRDTQLGEWANVKGVGRVPLDMIISEENHTAFLEQAPKNQNDFKAFDPETAAELVKLKQRYPHADNLISALLKDVAKNERDADEMDNRHSDDIKHLKQQIKDLIDKNDLEEAEYQGKKVELNKPKRGGSKKFYVYTRNPKTGKIKKVAFGAAGGGGNLAVKLKDPKARKAFADRHNCEKKNDKTKPGYWSCRLPRYAKSLGLSGGGTWW